MIDGKRYLRLRDKGHTKIVKKEKDTDYYLEFDRFDVEEGFLSEEPERQKIDLEEIAKRQDEVQRELKGIELFLNDYNQTAK